MDGKKPVLAQFLSFALLCVPDGSPLSAAMRCSKGQYAGYA